MDISNKARVIWHWGHCKACRLGLLAVLIGAVVCLGKAGGRSMTEWLLVREEQLRSWQALHPWLIFMAAFGCYVVACFLPGTNGKVFVVGWLFGTWWGAFVANMASMIVAAIEFYGARRWFRRYLRSRYAAFVLSADARLAREGPLFVVGLRLVPVFPFTLINALLGVSSLRFATFWWTTQLGTLPGNVAFAWTGANLPALHEIHALGWRGLLTLPLLTSLFVIAAIPILARYMLRRMSYSARRSVRAQIEQDQ